MSSRTSSRRRKKQTIDLTLKVENGLLQFCTGNESTIISMLSLSKDSNVEGIVTALKEVKGMNNLSPEMVQY